MLIHRDYILWLILKHRFSYLDNKVTSEVKMREVLKCSSNANMRPGGQREKMVSSRTKVVIEFKLRR